MLTLDQEQALTIQHYEFVPEPAPGKDDWVNKTIPPVDTVNNIVCGNVSSFSWFVIGYDKTLPTFELNRLKDTLWPPDHKLVKVATVTDVYDSADSSPKVTIKVTSSDASNGKGDGNTAQDWEVRKVNDTWEVWLRAERSGKGDRVYTITAMVTDASGNQATATHAVTVPHDRSTRSCAPGVQRRWTPASG